MSVLAVVLAAGSAARADVNIYWDTDTASAFHVTISGTGLDWEGTTVSPSGLWELYTQNWGEYLPDSVPDRPINIGNYGKVTFLGVFPPELNPDPLPIDYVMMAQPYNAFYPPTLPVQDGTSWAYGGFLLSDLGWSGYNPIALTSMPDVTDPLTWSWTAEYTASGPSIGLVPEPATASILLLGLMVLGRKAANGARRRIA